MNIDLQIGDWIADGFAATMTRGKVRSIHPRTYESYDGDFECNDYWVDMKTESGLSGFPVYNAVAIPLTVEILEANGFSVVKNGDTFTVWRQLDEAGTQSPQYDVTLYKADGDSRFDLTIQHFCTITMWVGYVHELQHALRLAKLGDMADEFKLGNNESN